MVGWILLVYPTLGCSWRHVGVIWKPHGEAVHRRCPAVVTGIAAYKHCDAQQNLGLGTPAAALQSQSMVWFLNSSLTAQGAALVLPSSVIRLCSGCLPLSVSMFACHATDDIPSKSSCAVGAVSCSVVSYWLTMVGCSFTECQ